MHVAGNSMRVSHISLASSCVCLHEKGVITNGELRTVSCPILGPHAKSVVIEEIWIGAVCMGCA